jgi:hypothetical protein
MIEQQDLDELVKLNILALPNLLWQNTTELGIYRRKNTTWSLGSFI